MSRIVCSECGHNFNKELDWDVVDVECPHCGGGDVYPASQFAHDPVDDDVLMFQYETIRRNGRTNMLDVEVVHELALEYGFADLAKRTGTIREYFKEVIDQYFAFDDAMEKKYQEWLEKENV